MNNIFLGADWHFSKWKKKEEMLKYDNRKNRDILRKYKSTVKDNDIFLFLGDLTEVRDDNPRLVKRCIEQIKELAQDCTTHLLECLVDPDTEEKVELNEEDKKDMYKFILDKTMEYAEENKLPDDGDDFDKYIEFIIDSLQ